MTDIHATAEAPLKPYDAYLSERKIAARLNISFARWESNRASFERAGLPRRDPLAGDKRWWPSVKAFFDRRNGLGPGRTPRAFDGPEHFK